jgi:hypothetical protein
MDTQDKNFLISTYIHVFMLWFLQQKIKENDLLNKYDRFIITRSDFFYSLPFPKMDILNPNNIWIPNGEDYGGLCDRTVVLSKSNIIQYINILDNIYNKSNDYYLKISNLNHTFNMEKILKFNLEQNDVLKLVKRFPYIMYCIRGHKDKTRWMGGTLNNELGYFIKYYSEYNEAIKYKKLLDTYNGNIDDFYIKYII